MKAYSMDLRRRVIAACDAGQPTLTVARVFGVSPAWVRRLKQHRRERGDITPRTGGGRRHGKIDAERLAEHVRRHPDATLLERIDAMGLSCAKSAMWADAAAEGQLQKKSLHAAEQDRPDVAAARAAWRLSQGGLDPRKLLFIDETWAKTNMTRTRGWCPIGERLLAKVPDGHWQTTTLVAALDCSGVRCSMTIDGAVNADAFESFTERILVPSLTPGDVVVMDNLSSHKGVRVRQLIESAQAVLLYLPPYSPDLNPIENAFSKLKRLLRSAGHRTREALWHGTRPLLDRITTGDAAGFFRHCGYTLDLA